MFCPADIIIIYHLRGEERNEGFTGSAALCAIVYCGSIITLYVENDVWFFIVICYYYLEGRSHFWVGWGGGDLSRFWPGPIRRWT